MAHEEKFTTYLELPGVLEGADSRASSKQTLEDASGEQPIFVRKDVRAKTAQDLVEPVNKEDGSPAETAARRHSTSEEDCLRVRRHSSFEGFKPLNLKPPVPVGASPRLSARDPIKAFQMLDKRGSKNFLERPAPRQDNDAYSYSKQALAILQKLEARFVDFERLLYSVANERLPVSTAKKCPNSDGAMSENSMQKPSDPSHKLADPFHMQAERQRMSRSPIPGEPAARQKMARSPIPVELSVNPDGNDAAKNQEPQRLVRLNAAVQEVAEEYDLAAPMDVLDVLQDRHHVDASQSILSRWTSKIECRGSDFDNLDPEMQYRSMSSKVRASVIHLDKIDLGEAQYTSRYFSFLVLHPHSRLRVALDIISFLMLFHDMLAAPYMLAWDYNLQTSIRYTLAVTAGFWVIDIALSFITGYYDDGQIEVNMDKVVKHYLKGFFAADVFMVITDITSFIGSHGLRFLRVIGLLRCLRMSRHLDELLDRFFTSDRAHNLFHFARLLWMVLWLSHITTCIWFMLGMYSGGSDLQAVWFDSIQFLPEGIDFIGSGALYQYTTSFHFALSQITASGVEMLSPLNGYERCVNIVFLIFGVFFSSHVVSTFSFVMMQLEITNSQKTQMYKQLNEFLTQYQVGHLLSHRVTRQIKERMNSSKRLTEEDVPALQFLSSVLLRELRYAMSGKQLTTHAVFRLFSNMSNGEDALQTLCDKAMTLVVYAKWDCVFLPGEDAQHVYILNFGLMTYEVFGMSIDHPNKFEQVQAGTWLSEATLWCKWRHVGEATATTQCQFFTLDVDRTYETVLKYERLSEIFLSYAKRYHTHLQAAEPPNAPYPDDLQVAYTEYSDIVMALPVKLQPTIGDVALLCLQQRRWGGAGLDFDLLEKLKKEIRDGKSLIIQNEQGSAERITHVTALRLTLGDGKIFAQVGKVAFTGVVTMNVMLPGGKQQRAELPRMALDRILFNSIFLDLAEHVQIESVERETIWKDSDRYNMRTKYTRTTHHGRLLLSEMPIAVSIPSPFSSSQVVPCVSVHDDDTCYHGLDSPAYRLGHYIFMALEPDDFEYFLSGKGVYILNEYSSRLQSEGLLINSGGNTNFARNRGEHRAAVFEDGR